MAGVPPVFKAWRKVRTPLLGSIIKKAWNSEPFERFRDRMRQACPGCEKKDLCMGGCSLMRRSCSVTVIGEQQMAKRHHERTRRSLNNRSTCVANASITPLF